MSTILKVALGTALGILLAGGIVAVAFVALGGTPVEYTADTGTRAAQIEPQRPTVTPVPTPNSRSLKTAAAAAAKPRPYKPPKLALVACDPNIRVNANTTTCEFAQNTFFAYWNHQGEGTSVMSVWSPAASDMLATTCTGRMTVVCTTDDGGEVQFPMSAVDSYDQDQADRYAASHDVGPDNSSSPDVEAESDASDCDPNYTGACLDASSYDYDCAGGTGDGPDYTGTVRVVGDDPFDLDRDGDGTACDD
jgi:hypothetical protein